MSSFLFIYFIAFLMKRVEKSNEKSHPLGKLMQKIYISPASDHVIQEILPFKKYDVKSCRLGPLTVRPGREASE